MERGNLVQRECILTMTSFHSRRLQRFARNDIQKELAREKPIITKKLFKQSSRIELIQGDGLAVKTSLSQGKKLPIRLTQNG